MTVVHILGDVREELAKLPADHYDTVVTSPPYWGLRDYGVDGQLGMEPTLGEHIDVMVEVCAEIWRVLKPEGTFWMNYGDCYATSPNGRSAAETKAKSDDDRTFRDKPFSTVGPIYGDGMDPFPPGRRGGGNNPAGGYLKPKDLCMVPNRMAIALQEWGWWVRSEIIWAKPNPMPESIKDRPATSHEKIYLLTKSGKYFYNADLVKLPATKTGTPGHLKPGKNSREHVRRTPGTDKQRGHGRRNDGFNDRWDAQEAGALQDRNLRNYEPAPMQVWRIATRAFSEAHFATFPPELVERCLKAGCPLGGKVLDPFGGAGTTGLVADRMQMDATLIELNPEYQQISLERINEDRGPLLNAMDGRS